MIRQLFLPLVGPISFANREWLCALLSLSITIAHSALAGEASESEFFEKRIRPVLVANCYKCHVGAKKESGLEVDSREHLLVGGDRGPAVIPGDPANSRLIQAIRHLPNNDLQMPPKKKLSNEQIQDFERWVAMGAPWPAASPVSPSGFSAEQQAHWAFQQVRAPEAPAIGASNRAATEIDRFILKRLEEAGLSPAPMADRRTLIRRATFDLTGLPPTPVEIRDFVLDRSPDAWTKVIDRLLASPRYGERQARHWLDLVRYAETDGHEFDTNKPNAYRYRDYVIAVFNDDLPYDQFVREQIAGDLLAKRRIRGDGSTFESPIGTGFYYLGEVQNNPVEPERDLANQVENQLDVLGKTFLALTIGCARCHDHKFDPISSRDYYALAGFLYSTEKTQACLDTPGRIAAIEERRLSLQEGRKKIASLLAPARRRLRMQAANRLKDYLLAAREAMRGRKEYRLAEIELAAGRRHLDLTILQAWVDYLETLESTPDGIFDLWARLVPVSNRHFAEDLKKELEENQVCQTDRTVPELFADFETEALDGWQQIGAAFVAADRAEANTFGMHAKRAASSNRGTSLLLGRLVSPRFTIRHPYIWFRLGGGNDRENLRLSVCINGQPIPTLTRTGNGYDDLARSFFDVHDLIGKEAFLEIVDESGTGHISVDDIRFADEPPGAPPIPRTLEQKFASATDPGTLAAAYESAILAAFESDPGSASDTPLDEWVLRGDTPLAVTEHLQNGKPSDEWGFPDSLTQQLTELQKGELSGLAKQCRELERDFPASTVALVARDGAPEDAWLQVRGEYTNRGPQIPRGFLSEIGPQHPQVDRAASGRLQLAEWIASPANPLTARVIVNRVWQHHFGVGIVRSVDNFGVMGEAPSHPELLDYLAERFVASGWSLKSLHRRIMLSSVYRQASPTTDRSKGIDAENRLLASWPPRRIEAESIRDAMLAVAGNLNGEMFGPSVPLYLDDEAEGRDAPPVQGPPDGDRRRTIYLNVRRNYMAPFLAAFDFPRPTGTVGQRQSSAVPNQALSLLNDEFVQQQARIWATRVLKQWKSSEQRIDRMYLECLGRPPDDRERQAMLRFVERQQRDYSKLAAYARNCEQSAWSDLAHVMFNLGEFVFLR